VRGACPVREGVVRVLLIDEDTDRAVGIAAALEAAGCAVVAVRPEPGDLTRLVREAAADVIVCDIDEPGRDALESMRALHHDEPRPVVVFAARGEPDQIEAAIEAGVAAYVVDGLAPHRLRPVLEVAIRRFRAHQELRARLEQTQATLAERVVIERAKGVLMQRRHLSEPEAYRLLRRWSMDRGEKLARVAQDFLRKL
jgi:response regulator NasT